MNVYNHSAYKYKIYSISKYTISLSSESDFAVRLWYSQNLWLVRGFLLSVSVCDYFVHLGRFVLVPLFLVCEQSLLVANTIPTKALFVICCGFGNPQTKLICYKRVKSGLMTFHCMDMLHFVFPFIYWFRVELYTLNVILWTIPQW